MSLKGVDVLCILLTGTLLCCICLLILFYLSWHVVAGEVAKNFMLLMQFSIYCILHFTNESILCLLKQYTDSCKTPSIVLVFQHCFCILFKHGGWRVVQQNPRTCWYSFYWERFVFFRPNRAIADLIDLALWHERAGRLLPNFITGILRVVVYLNG